MAAGIMITFCLALLCLGTIDSISAAIFRFENKCGFTVWPETLSFETNQTTGLFALSSGSATELIFPAGWYGRIWARTGCKFDAAGKGGCSTGADPPVTVAEVELSDNVANKDYYIVSLVYGYNIGIGLRPTDGRCHYAGCVSDLNPSCPPELQAKDSGSAVACKSACDALKKPEYCCTGAHNTSETCPPTKYSKLFKNACPFAYSYNYDNVTSFFSCASSNYTITFCPNKDDSGKGPSHSSKGFRPRFTTEGIVFSVFALFMFLMF